MSTSREKTVGEQLVAAFQFIDEPDRSFRALAIAIDAAVQAERERAAKIAEAHLSDYRNNLSASSVAAAIREGRPQE
jgi:hypothetical protein